jgi:biotin-(acetyl-CoA carboxylase) ligase
VSSYSLYSASSGWWLSVLQAEWEANHLWHGRSVSLIAGVSQVDGVVLGIDSQGALRLKVDGVEKVLVVVSSA